MTAKRWLSILETSYIVFTLQPYPVNFGKRVIKTPKLYFYDTGLVCNLLRITAADLAVHPYRGQLFESFIIAELYKWYYNHNRLPRLYFWRDQSGHEVDCILDEGMRLIPIEIKASRTANRRFFEEIDDWIKLTKGVPEKNAVAAREESQKFVVFGDEAAQPRAYASLVSWQ